MLQSVPTADRVRELASEFSVTKTHLEVMRTDCVDAARVWTERNKGYLLPSQNTMLWLANNGVETQVESMVWAAMSLARVLDVYVSENSPELEQAAHDIRTVYGTEVTIFSGSRESRLNELDDRGLKYDFAIAYGSDQTCRSVLNRLPADIRRVAYGSKTSVAVLPDTFEDIEALAEDVYSYDGTGCLNVSAVYVVGQKGDAMRIAEELQEYSGKFTTPRTRMMARINFDCPKTERVGPFTRLRKTTQESPEDKLGIGNGTVAVVYGTFPEILEELGVLGQYLSTAVVEDELLLYDLVRCGVTRFAKPGHSQKPSGAWMHDGLPLIAESHLMVGEGFDE